MLSRTRPLPYTVDVVDLHRIGDSFRRIVESQRAPLALDGHGTARQVRVADHLSGETATGKAGLASTSIQRPESPFAQLLVEPVRNGIYKKKEFHGRGVKIVNMGELFANPRLRDVHMRRVELSELEQHRFGVQAGDLLFARRSLVAEGAGKCCVVLEINEPTAFESSIIRARPDPKKADSLFLYYYFNSPVGLHALDTIRRQVAVAGITGTDLAQLPLEVPPLPEQRAIAHVLGTLDDKIELNRRMNETLEAMARALFKSWFVSFEPVRAKMEGRWRRGESLPGLAADLYDLFPDRLVDSELGEVPEGWEVQGLGELCSLRSGSVFRKASQGKPSGKYPFIKVGDMNLATNSVGISDANNWIDEADLNQLKAKPFPIDATVFAKIGEGLKQNRIRILLRPTLIDNNMMAAVPNADAIDPLVLFYALSQFDFGEVAGGTALPYLTVRSLNALTVPVPRLEEQIPLAEPLRLMHRRHIANEIESHTLTARRDVLLPKLVSGEVRI